MNHTFCCYKKVSSYRLNKCKGYFFPKELGFKGFFVNSFMLTAEKQAV